MLVILALEGGDRRPLEPASMESSYLHTLNLRNSMSHWIRWKRDREGFLTLTLGFSIHICTYTYECWIYYFLHFHEPCLWGNDSPSSHKIEERWRIIPHINFGPLHVRPYRPLPIYTRMCTCTQMENCVLEKSQWVDWLLPGFMVRLCSIIWPVESYTQPA